MPFDVEYAKPARFRVRASGDVTLQEIEALFKGLVADPNLSGADMLVDASAVEGVPSTPELRIVARELLTPIVDHGLIAVGIVSSNPFIYGMARMFVVFAEAVGARVGAFRDFDEAHRWLAERRDERTQPEAEPRN